MKYFGLVCLAAIICAVAPASANGGDRCKRGIRFCGVNVNLNETQFIRYDTCLQICCGRQLVNRDVNLECCGDQDNGTIFNTETQICCRWRNQHRVHERIDVSANTECCGLVLLDPEVLTTYACCNSYENEPMPFNYLNEMCCMGVRQPSGNTAYTQCCGDTAFDRRRSSCPCQDDVVYFGVPQNVAGCCVGPMGVRNAFNRNTQACCAGIPYNRTTQFCCGTSIGVKSEEICCSDSVVVPRDLDIRKAKSGCCRLMDGSYVVYNTVTQACCGERVQNLDPSIIQICCGSTLYDVAINGSMCCGVRPYFPENQVCCDGVVGVGDMCCAGQPFVSMVGRKQDLVCCEDRIVNGTMCCGDIGFYEEEGQYICCAGQLRNALGLEVPACCVDQSYDSFSQTCCGSTVYPNPRFLDGISRMTRCCGDFAMDSSLRPYDYTRQLCCDGAIANLPEGTSLAMAECCGTNALDISDQLCCDGVPVDNPYDINGECCDDFVINRVTEICCGGMARNRTDYGCCEDGFFNRNTQICCPGKKMTEFILDLGEIPPQFAQCCGDDVIDIRTEICCDGRRRSNLGIPATYARCCGNTVSDNRTNLCCDGVVQPRGGLANAMCCGQNVFNPLTQLCCDGEPRDLNGIPIESAICCGDRCINGEVFWCCKGQQYRRGSVAGQDIESITCAEAFIP